MHCARTCLKVGCERAFFSDFLDDLTCPAEQLDESCRLLSAEEDYFVNSDADLPPTELSAEVLALVPLSTLNIVAYTRLIGIVCVIHMSTQEFFDPILQELYKDYDPRNRGTRVEQDPSLCADFAKACDPDLRSDH